MQYKNSPLRVEQAAIQQSLQPITIGLENSCPDGDVLGPGMTTWECTGLSRVQLLLSCYRVHRMHMLHEMHGWAWDYMVRAAHGAKGGCTECTECMERLSCMGEHGLH